MYVFLHWAESQSDEFSIGYAGLYHIYPEGADGFAHAHTERVASDLQDHWEHTNTHMKPHTHRESC